MELDITGARILWETPINVPILGQLKISETMVVSWLVMLLITGACIWLTRDLKEENISKKQALAELIVEKANQFVVGIWARDSAISYLLWPRFLPPAYSPT